MKTADVQTIAVERVSTGYFAAAIRGTIAAVRQAVRPGRGRRGSTASSARRRCTHAAEQSAALLANGTSDRLARAIEAAP